MSTKVGTVKVTQFGDDGLAWDLQLPSDTNSDDGEMLARLVARMAEVADNVGELQSSLEKMGFEVVIDVMTYPHEDKCRECGAHVGWILAPAGDMFALGICDDCQDKLTAEGHADGEEGE